MAKKKKKIQKTTPEDRAKMEERQAFIDGVVERAMAEVKAREAKSGNPRAAA